MAFVGQTGDPIGRFLFAVAQLQYHVAIPLQDEEARQSGRSIAAPSGPADDPHPPKCYVRWASPVMKPANARGRRYDAACAAGRTIVTVPASGGCNEIVKQ